MRPISLYTENVPQDLFSTRSDIPLQEYLLSLNPEQRSAVETTEGPLLILAGAGTGKTRVLTTRFAHLLLTGRAYPSQILAVTFTNKAAREMRERVGGLLNEPVEGLWLGTFHALCTRMLRRHAEHVGLSRNFTILDTDDQLRLLKQILPLWNVDTKRWPPHQLLGIIQRWKDRALLPQNISPAEDSDFADGRAREIYAAYQDRLKSLNACDFGDLMLHVTEILRTQPEILAQYHRQFRYLLVDEYQDTNTIQYLWLRLLAKHEDGRPANIACVGDDDQSIYSWRGAEIENILRFEKDFPGAQIIRLERNYRSTPQILRAASGLIAHNEGRLGKTLHSAEENRQGERVQVVAVQDSDEEARIVGRIIANLREDGHALREMAILVRAGFQTRPFEEKLMASNLPYRVIGGLRFYERAEIRDCIAYMRVLAQPADDLALERIINVPKRGVGAVALNKLHQISRERGVPLTEALRHQLDGQNLKGKSAQALSALMDNFQEARTRLAAQGHVVAADYLLEESGYLQMWRDDRSVEAAGRLENVREFLRALGEFGTMDEFLEHVALVMDTEAQETEDKVSLMTLHGAKGLEFDTVFLPGWEEGIFPSQRSLDEGGNQALEEERRLAYVGLTRARQRAIVLHAASRRIYANWQTAIPSRFIDEIPADSLIINEQGPRHSFGRRAGTPWGSPSPFGSGTARRSTPRAFAASEASYDGAAPRIPLGATVLHPRFGQGVVISTEGERVEVNFEQAGIKRIMAGFVEVIS